MTFGIKTLLTEEEIKQLLEGNIKNITETIDEPYDTLWNYKKGRVLLENMPYRLIKKLTMYAQQHANYFMFPEHYIVSEELFNALVQHNRDDYHANLEKLLTYQLLQERLSKKESENNFERIYVYFDNFDDIFTDPFLSHHNRLDFETLSSVCCACNICIIAKYSTNLPPIFLSMVRHLPDEFYISSLSCFKSAQKVDIHHPLSTGNLIQMFDDLHHLPFDSIFFILSYLENQHNLTAFFYYYFNKNKSNIKLEDDELIDHYNKIILKITQIFPSISHEFLDDYFIK